MCFGYGTRAYRAVDNYVYERTKRFLVRRHKVPSRRTACFSDEVVFGDLGLLRLRRVHLGPPPCPSSTLQLRGASGLGIWDNSDESITIRSNAKPRLRIALAKQRQKVRKTDGDTAPGGGITGAGDMQKNGAAAPGGDRVVVIPQFDKDIIEAVVPPQGFMPGCAWKTDQAVVVGVGGIVTPAVGGADRAAGKGAAGRRPPVGTVHHPAQGKTADGSDAVSFPLALANAAKADGATDLAPAPRQNPRRLDLNIHERVITRSRLGAKEAEVLAAEKKIH